MPWRIGFIIWRYEERPEVENWKFGITTFTKRWVSEKFKIIIKHTSKNENAAKRIFRKSDGAQKKNQGGSELTVIEVDTCWKFQNQIWKPNSPR